MKRRKPQIVRISKEEMGRKIGKQFTGVKAFTSGRRIYLSPKADKYDLEHELLHVRMGHKKLPKRPVPFAYREVMVEKKARGKFGKGVTRNYLTGVYQTLREKYDSPVLSKREKNAALRTVVNRAAKKYGIKHRI